MIYPLEDQFHGERGGRLRDTFGQQWLMSQHIENVPAYEMARRPWWRPSSAGNGRKHPAAPGRWLPTVAGNSADDEREEPPIGAAPAMKRPAVGRVQMGCSGALVRVSELAISPVEMSPSPGVL